MRVGENKGSLYLCGIIDEEIRDLKQIANSLALSDISFYFDNIQLFSIFAIGNPI